jgi:hypothetical protein
MYKIQSYYSNSKHNNDEGTHETSGEKKFENQITLNFVITCYYQFQKN